LIHKNTDSIIKAVSFDNFMQYLLLQLVCWSLVSTWQVGYYHIHSECSVTATDRQFQLMAGK